MYETVFNFLLFLQIFIESILIMFFETIVI